MNIQKQTKCMKVDGKRENLKRNGAFIYVNMNIHGKDSVDASNYIPLQPTL